MTTPTKTPGELAQQFHEAYERLAPQFGYKAREESAVKWEDVPNNNRNLMIAICTEILGTLKQAALTPEPEKPMKETPTPESFAALCRYTGGELVRFPQGLGNGVVPYEVAVKLERERDEARRDRAMAGMGQLEVLAKERDQLRKELDELKQDKWRIAYADMIAELERERDQLRKELDEASEAFEQLAHNFPAIQTDCESPIKAAQFINMKWEQSQKQLTQCREVARGLADGIKNEHSRTQVEDNTGNIIVEDGYFHALEQALAHFEALEKEEGK